MFAERDNRFNSNERRDVTFTHDSDKNHKERPPNPSNVYYSLTPPQRKQNTLDLTKAQQILEEKLLPNMFKKEYASKNKKAWDTLAPSTQVTEIPAEEIQTAVKKKRRPTHKVLNRPKQGDKNAKNSGDRKDQNLTKTDSARFPMANDFILNNFSTDDIEASSETRATKLIPKLDTPIPVKKATNFTKLSELKETQKKRKDNKDLKTESNKQKRAVGEAAHSNSGKVDCQDKTDQSAESVILHPSECVNETRELKSILKKEVKKTVSDITNNVVSSKNRKPKSHRPKSDINIDKTTQQEKPLRKDRKYGYPRTGNIDKNKKENRLKEMHVPRIDVLESKNRCLITAKNKPSKSKMCKSLCLVKQPEDKEYRVEIPKFIENTSNIEAVLNTCVSTETVNDYLNPKECFTKGYHFTGKELGYGSTGKVMLGIVRATKLSTDKFIAASVKKCGHKMVAVKVVNKELFDPDRRLSILKEMEALKELRHVPEVVNVFEVFESPKWIYMITEYCKYGNLLKYVHNRFTKFQLGVTEKQAKLFFKKIVTGLESIHKAHIPHRNLKAENILLDENYNVRITDISYSSDPPSPICCSLYYVAPEVLSSLSYNGFISDIWSLGIILHLLINNHVPFGECGPTEHEAKEQKFLFRKGTSEESEMLIRRLLQFKPEDRPTLLEIQDDPWLVDKQIKPMKNVYPSKKGSYTLVSTVKRLPKRQTSSVILQKNNNNEAAETVTLRSRRMYKITSNNEAILGSQRQQNVDIYDSLEANTSSDKCTKLQPSKPLGERITFKPPKYKVTEKDLTKFLKSKPRKLPTIKPSITNWYGTPLKTAAGSTNVAAIFDLPVHCSSSESILCPNNSETKVTNGCHGNPPTRTSSEVSESSIAGEIHVKSSVKENSPPEDTSERNSISKQEEAEKQKERKNIDKDEGVVVPDGEMQKKEEGFHTNKTDTSFENNHIPKVENANKITEVGNFRENCQSGCVKTNVFINIPTGDSCPSEDNGRLSTDARSDEHKFGDDLQIPSIFDFPPSHVVTAECENSSNSSTLEHNEYSGCEDNIEETFETSP